MKHELQFDAISEQLPGSKWLERWNRSWPSYRRWFLSRNGDTGPSRRECESALREHMPELVPTWKQLSDLAGNDDLAAQFLSTWCPPAYLGGCSLAALSKNGSTRLVRNYDLSPELNEGLLLRTEWTGTPVMGMVEFLWGISDGINQKGLAVALAFGGSSTVGRGFGITTILRYVLETCGTVEEALEVLCRVPSHMAYNVTLADKSGMTLSVEMQPGGGLQVMHDSVATNHQQGLLQPERPQFTQTYERFDHLIGLMNTDIEPASLVTEFMKSPLYQDKYSESLGTLFTADYNPAELTLDLHWQGSQWAQSLDEFQEGTRQIVYGPTPLAHSYDAISISVEWVQYLAVLEDHVSDRVQFSRWMDDAQTGEPDWTEFASIFHKQTTLTRLPMVAGK